MPEQQPLEQLVASQMQVALAPVPEQRVPDGQAPPVEPHTHCLAVVSQRLVAVPTQVPQDAPAAPQAVSVSGCVVLGFLPSPPQPCSTSTATHNSTFS